MSAGENETTAQCVSLMKNADVIVKERSMYHHFHVVSRNINTQVQHGYL